jgi:hypothetical protein
LKAKIFLLVLLGLSLLVIPAGMGHASSVDNLIVNPGFEDGTDNFPAGWEITGAFSGSSHKGINKCYFWGKTAFRSGESSLCLFNERASEDFGKAHGRMLCISQAVNVLSDNTYYQFSFWSKGEKVSLNDESVVRVAAVITGEGEFKTIYRNFAKFATEENYDWKEVKNNIFVPKGATKIAIYIQLDGKTTSGRVWFDDFSLCDKSNLSQYKQSFPFSTEFDRKIADVTKNLLAQPRQIYASYGTPVIDGQLNDLCWQDTSKINGFLLPGTNSFANEDTDVLLSYDEKNLYLAFNCYTADTLKLRASAEKTEHDATLWYDDCVEVFIYSRDKKITAHLIANAKGARWDGLHRELLPDTSWNPAWTASVSIGQKSWVVEASIPIQELISILGSPDNWRINLCRENKVNGENSSICFLPESVRFLQPDRFAVLSCIKDKASLPKEDIALTRIRALHDLEKRRLESVIADDSKDGYKFKYAFDFGTLSSPLKRGFIGIEPESRYASILGYGWIKNNAMSGVNRGVEKGSGSPNELTCDFIEGKSDSVFRIDLPDGEYMVYLICGDTIYPSPTYKVYSGNTELANIAVGGRYNFQPFSFPARVSDNKLLLTFKGNNGWLVNALIIYKKEDLSQAQTVLNKIEREIYLGSADRIIKFARYEYNETNPLPADTDKKGYLIFSSNYLDILYPNSIPRKEEMAKDLKLFAAPGEYEPATFSILPLKDMKNVRISISNLQNGKDIIGRSSINVQMVKYHYHNVAMSNPPTYMLFPKVLEDYAASDLAKGMAVKIWLTVKIPETARAGRYWGKIIIEAENAPASVISLSCEVLPFRLDELKDTTFNMCYHLPLNYPERGVDGWKLLEKDLIDMKEHGMNSVNLFVIGQNLWSEFGQRGKSINVEAFLKFLRLCKKTGLSQPLPLNICPYFPWDPNQATSKRALDIQEWEYVARAIKELEAKVKQEGLPEIYWYIDEPYNETRKHNTLAFLEFLKGCCPTAKTFVTMFVDSSDSQNVDIFCPNPHQLSKALLANPDYFQTMRAKGKSIWTYNGAANPFIPSACRFNVGFYMWRLGVAGQLNFTYQLYYYHRNLYNPLDNPGPVMYGHTYPGSEGPISTITWEAIREGIDDLRYIKTLERHIESAEKRKDAAALKVIREAKLFLTDLQARISVNYDDYEVKDSNGAPLYKQPVWTTDLYDAYRRKIADFIIKLQ